jgi:integrase/recombinase XerD
MPVARRWQNPERRLVLKLEAWPAADREAWARGSAQGGLLDEAGPAASWSAVVRKKRLISYGRWLGFLARTDRLEAGQGPAERVTRENVAAYLEALTADCAPVTVWGYVADLAIMLEVLAPEADHAWLRRLALRLQTRMRPSVDRARRLVPVGRLYQEGLTMMQEALAEPVPVRHARPANRLLAREVLFRDGLILSFLAACPLRRRSFEGLELGRHLVRHSDCYRLQLEPGDLKNGTDMTVPLPVSLTPWLDHYLALVRPRLLQGRESPKLWVSRQGRPMTCNSLGLRVEKVTSRRLGRRLGMHLFRHCAATSLALEAPEHVRQIPALLGHRRLATSERYYNLAEGSTAAASYQEGLLALRHRLQEEARRPQRRG